MANVRSIQELLKSFEEYIQKQYTAGSPENLYLPVQYLLSIGGKRIRPMSVLLLNEILEGNFQWALQAAWSIELFHNFTLMHDDIMDGSTLRRSQLTTHEKFGVNSAILSGDIMLIHAMEHINQLEKQSGNSNISLLFLKTAVEVCRGQALDMQYEQSEYECTVENYLEMIRLKTAVLLACSFSFAALINPEKEYLKEDLYNLGLHLGMSFQIQDDWLDVYGGQDKVGKMAGGDILKCKKSILILEAWPFLQKSDKEYYHNVTKSSEEGKIKVQHFTKLFSDFQLSEKVTARINFYSSICQEHLRQLSAKGMDVSSLTPFIQDLFERKF